MDVGPLLRRAREDARLSLAVVADEAGVTKGYLSRLENGRCEPRLAVLRQIAAVVGLEPVVVLVPAGAAATRQAETMRNQTPDQRLTAAAREAYDTLAHLLWAFPDELVLTGPAAAIAQAVPAALDVLDVVLPDSDDIVERLITVLRRCYAIYDDISVADYRALGRDTWPVGEFDARIWLRTDPPVTTPVAFVEWTVPVVCLPRIAEEFPAVAAALGRLPSTGVG
jgi:transcriptional regulator with XRE-family HTH domain